MSIDDVGREACEYVTHPTPSFQGDSYLQPRQSVEAIPFDLLDEDSSVGTRSLISRLAEGHHHYFMTCSCQTGSNFSDHDLDAPAGWREVVSGHGDSHGLLYALVIDPGSPVPPGFHMKDSNVVSLADYAT